MRTVDFLVHFLCGSWAAKHSLVSLHAPEAQLAQEASSHVSKQYLLNSLVQRS